MNKNFTTTNSDIHFDQLADHSKLVPSLQGQNLIESINVSEDNSSLYTDSSLNFESDISNDERSINSNDNNSDEDSIDECFISDDDNNSNNESSDMSIEKKNISNIDNDKFVKDIDMKDNINITFIGEINAGKSSLINSLIGDDLLSVGIRRTTLSNTSVISTSTLENNLEHNNCIYLSKSNRMDIFFKNNKVCLIDTIGLNDPCKDKEQYEWFNKNLDKSDIVFFVTSYEKCFSTESEQNAFKKIYYQINEMNKLDHNICLGIILTKIDTKNSDKEYKKQVKEINNFLKSLKLEKEIPIVHIWNKELLLSRQIIELGKNTDSIKKLGVMNIEDLKNLNWFSKFGGEELKKVINKFIAYEWKSLDHAKECKSKYLLNIFISKYKNDEEYHIPVNDFLNLLKDIKTSYLKPYLEKIKVCYDKFNFNEIVENNNIFKKIHNFGYILNNFSSVEEHIFETFVNNKFNNYDLEINVEKYLLEKLKKDYEDSYFLIKNKLIDEYELYKDLSECDIYDIFFEELNYEYDSVSAKINLYKKKLQKSNEISVKGSFTLPNMQYTQPMPNINYTYKNSSSMYIPNNNNNIIKNYNIKDSYSDSDSDYDIVKNNIYKNNNYILDKTITLSNDYNLEDIEKYDELFKKIYKYELLKDKNSILIRYLQYKLKKLINLKIYYDQLYNLNVEKYDELREIFGLIFKNPPKLGEGEDVLKIKRKENKLNFTGLEKFIVEKLDEDKSKFSNLDKLIHDKVEEYKLLLNNSNKNSINIKDRPKINRDDIIVLLDRENVTNKVSKYLLNNYNVRSYRTDNFKLKKKNKIKPEKDIVVKNLGKNTVDFNIIKDAQKYLSETDKFVVVYTNDHYGQIIEKNERYMCTSDYKMIELYFNIEPKKEENEICKSNVI